MLWPWLVSLSSSLSHSGLDTQACLCPVGCLSYAGTRHEQCLGSKPLAKHSRFFGHKHFLKGPGTLPGPGSFCLCPTQIAFCI